jgi:hypothetical protein
MGRNVLKKSGSKQIKTGLKNTCNALIYSVYIGNLLCLNLFYYS